MIRLRELVWLTVHRTFNISQEEIIPLFDRIRILDEEGNQSLFEMNDRNEFEAFLNSLELEDDGQKLPTIITDAFLSACDIISRVYQIVSPGSEFINYGALIVRLIKEFDTAYNFLNEIETSHSDNTSDSGKTSLNPARRGKNLVNLANPDDAIFVNVRSYPDKPIEAFIDGVLILLYPIYGCPQYAFTKQISI